MRKGIVVLVLCLAFLTGEAQTGIGTTTPHASAKLEVSATNKGFLPPRVTLTSATDGTTIPSPAEGLLVYNVGSVGLLSGYYYWNGVNWSTLVNALVAMDMVKLYSSPWSGATGTIEHVNGYSFTVPVSGRYVFDFSSGAFTNNSKFTMSFKVRLGSTDLATDTQTSANSYVHVEYNGKLEVNLQIGVTYNVFVTGGTQNTDDYNRVYYKLVSGNLPVNQHMVYRNFQLNNNYLSNDGDNEGIRIDNSGNVGIGTAIPNASALLDLSSTTQGVLPPRVSLVASNNSSSPVASPAIGLLVYNNASTGTYPNQVTPGYYYWDGTLWTRIGNSSLLASTNVTVSATITAPTLGPRSTDRTYVIDNGVNKTVHLQLGFTGGNSGSGDYLFSLPTGVFFNTNAGFNPVLSGTMWSSIAAMSQYLIPFSGGIVQSGIWNTTGFIVPYSSTTYRIVLNHNSLGGMTLLGSSWYGTAVSTMINLSFDIW